MQVAAVTTLAVHSHSSVTTALFIARKRRTPQQQINQTERARSFLILRHSCQPPVHITQQLTQWLVPDQKLHT